MKSRFLIGNIFVAVAVLGFKHSQNLKIIHFKLYAHYMKEIFKNMPKKPIK